MKDNVKIELHEFVAWTEDHLDAVITVDCLSEEVKCVVQDKDEWYDVPLSKENKLFIIIRHETLLHYEVQTHSHEMYDMNVLSLHVHVNNKMRKITIDASDYDLNPDIVNILYDIREGRDAVRCISKMLNKHC